GLGHTPGAIGGIRRPGLERLDSLLYPKIPRYVGDEVSDQWKASHGLDRHRRGEIELVQPRHAHQSRMPIDLCGTGSTFARLAIPAHRQIVYTFRLDLVDGVEHHHTFRYRRRVVLELAARGITSPDPERRRCRHVFLDSLNPRRSEKKNHE